MWEKVPDACKQFTRRLPNRLVFPQADHAPPVTEVQAHRAIGNDYERSHRFLIPHIHEESKNRPACCLGDSYSCRIQGQCLLAKAPIGGVHRVFFAAQSEQTIKESHRTNPVPRQKPESLRWDSARCQYST